MANSTTLQYFAGCSVTATSERRSLLISLEATITSQATVNTGTVTQSAQTVSAPALATNIEQAATVAGSPTTLPSITVSARSIRVPQVSIVFAVEFKGIIVSDFNTFLRYKFRNMTANVTGFVCGSLGTDACTIDNVNPTAVATNAGNLLVRTEVSIRNGLKNQAAAGASRLNSLIMSSADMNTRMNGTAVNVTHKMQCNYGEPVSTYFAQSNYLFGNLCAKAVAAGGISQCCVEYETAIATYSG